MVVNGIIESKTQTNDVCGLEIALGHFASVIIVLATSFLVIGTTKSDKFKRNLLLSYSFSFCQVSEIIC